MSQLLQCLLLAPHRLGESRQFPLRQTKNKFHLSDVHRPILGRNVQGLINVNSRASRHGGGYPGWRKGGLRARFLRADIALRVRMAECPNGEAEQPCQVDGNPLAAQLDKVR